MLEETERNLTEVRQRALGTGEDTLYDVACVGLTLLRRVRELDEAIWTLADDHDIDSSEVLKAIEEAKAEPTEEGI